jgi:CHRD domain
VKRLISCGLVLSMPLLVGSADFAAGQHESMKMSMNTLFVAQLDAKQVVGGSISTATGTGAFLLDRTQRTLGYNLTYEGLASGGAQSVAIYNFGQGKNGEVVKVLCGADARPCPDGPSATISGRLEQGDGRPLDNNLLGEFASERTYVEIVGKDGKPEIRGQLSPNSAMVMVTNYTVNLTPAEGTDSKGTGTAVVSETHLPGGKVSVFYAATVAGTSGAPTNAALVNGPTPQARLFTTRSALPKMQLRSSRDKKSGGSFTGVYEVNRSAPTALFVTRLVAEGKGEPGIVVTTSRFPNGELYGALVLVP